MSKDITWSIYGVVHNGGIIYVGSTSIPIEKRFASHLEAAQNFGKDGTKLSPFHTWLHLLMKNGESPSVMLLDTAILHGEAIKKENLWISRLRGQILNANRASKGCPVTRHLRRTHLEQT